MYIKPLRNFGIWIIGTFLALMITATIILLFNGSAAEELKEFLPYIATQFWKNPIGWFFLILPYILFCLTKYLVQSWKKT